MAFTRKLKTVSKWFALNELMRHDDALRGALEGDGGIAGILTEMEGLLTSLYAEETGGSAQDAGISIALFPCPKRLYFGELAYDTFTPTLKTVKSGPNRGRKYTAYIGNYGARFAEAAGRLRDRIWTIIEIARQNNDLTNADKEPNPGGRVDATPQ